MKQIKDHSDLLKRYTKSEIYVICETSGNISESCRVLKDRIEEYALSFGLDAPIIDWDIYIYQEE